jgi:hypothetical protein
MIWESRYWKDDLLRQAKRLRARAQQKRWPGSSSAQVEQLLMGGFYAVRKLIESKKLSDSLSSKAIQVLEFAPTGKRIHLYNWHHIDRLYKLDSSKGSKIDLFSLCHQFVHSYIFLLSFDEARKLHGVFVTSDRKRSSCLYYIDLQKIVDIFEQVGHDYPANGSFEWDEKKGDYEVRNS